MSNVSAALNPTLDGPLARSSDAGSEPRRPAGPAWGTAHSALAARPRPSNAGLQASVGPPHPLAAGPANRADRGAVGDLSSARLLCEHAHPTVGLQSFDPDGGMAARQRPAGRGQPGRVDLLHAQRPRHRRPGSSGAAETSRSRTRAHSVECPRAPRLLSATANSPGDPASASRRRRLALDVRA